MPKYFYTGVLNPENSAVIYRYTASSLEELTLIDGYLDAAKMIIGEIKKYEKIETIHDALIYPLLNIYSCVIEFVLKATIKKIVKHINRSGCSFLKKPDQNIQDVLMSHNNSKLLDICLICLNNDNFHPHQFTNINLLKPIVREFELNGVDAMSTRYHYSKTKQIYTLYREQKNVNILKLQEDIENAIKKLRLYIEDRNFPLCAMGCFTQKGLDSLNNILNISKNKKGLFQLLPKPKEFQVKRFPPQIVLMEDIIEDICRPFSKEEMEFYNQVQSLPLEEKNAILKCLYLGPRVLEVIGLEDNFQNQEASEKIWEYKHWYQKGIENLSAEIKYIEQFVSSKH